MSFPAFFRRLALGRSSAVAAALLLGATGCTTLPDTQPFTTATVSLQGAIASSGAAVMAEVKATSQPEESKAPANLERAWVTRNEAMKALVAYARSLEEITAAGRAGEDSARKLVEAAGALAGVVGQKSAAASEAGKLVGDTFMLISGEIARARAAKSLEAALAQLQPVMERLAQLLAADLQSLDELLRIAAELEKGALVVKYNDAIGFRGQLLRTQTKLQNEIQTQLGKGTPPSQLKEADELARVVAMLGQGDAAYAEYTRAEAALDARLRAGRQLIAETGPALTAWAASHGNLLVALRTKRPPNVAEVLAATGRIRALSERYRRL
jgi:hypothetical protein